MNADTTDIVSIFDDTKRKDYIILSELLSGFIKSIIKENFKINDCLPVLHSVTNRVKTIESLNNKIENKSPPPKQLDDIDDLAGIRIIFYFKDDLKKFIESPIKDWFGRGAKDSVDLKSKSLDQFGYNSFHFTVTVGKGCQFWESLRNYDRERFDGFKCEIQVRTILQHAWAETAHDIIYKNAKLNGENDVETQKAERTWNAMSATLELLDGHLITLKQGKIKASHQNAPKLLEPILEDWAKKHELYKYNNVLYPYIVLHQGELSNIKHNDSDWSLYNSSKEFGTENYKKLIWDQIKTKDRSFINNLHSYDSTIVRAKHWDSKSTTLTLQPALYSDQITTNHSIAHDCNPSLKAHKVVRDYAFDVNGKLNDFNKSPLVNSVGVSCVIRTSDNYWVIGRRKQDLSVFSGTWSCPVSGAVEWRERLCWEPSSLKEWVVNSLILECDQELGLEISPDYIHYLGFCREIKRLGKPQFFFFIDMYKVRGESYSSTNIESRYNIYRVDYEFSKLDFILRDSAENLVSENWEDVMQATRNEDVSTELRMNIALAMSYIKKS